MLNKEVQLSTHAERADGVYSGLRFEPGLHFGKSPSVWNAEVKKRMKNYNLEIIAVDSWRPSRLEYVGREEALEYYLPGQPSDINNVNNEIFAIRGDVSSEAYYSDLVSPVIQFTGTRRDRFSEIMSKVKNIDERGKFDFSIGYGAENVATALTFMFFKTLAEKDFQRVSRVDRRGFFKLGASFTGNALLGLLLARVATSVVAPLTVDEQSRDLMNRLASIVRPIYEDGGWWVDGRTALLIAKTQDSIDILGKPRNTPGAIVMGSAHTFQAERLLSDDMLRENAIRKFGSKILLTVDSILDQYGSGNDVKSEAREAIISSIEFTDIVRIPVFDGYQNDLMVVESFESPRVRRVLADLRK